MQSAAGLLASTVEALVEQLRSADAGSALGAVYGLQQLLMECGDAAVVGRASAVLAFTALAPAAVPALLRAFRRVRRSYALAEAAGDLLCDLALLPPLQPLLVEHDAIEAAVQLLQRGQLVVQAAGLLANLTEQSAEQQRAAVARGGVAALTHCLQPFRGLLDSSSRQEAARALVSLMQCPEGRLAARQADAFTALEALLEQRSIVDIEDPVLPQLLTALVALNDWRTLCSVSLQVSLGRLAASRNLGLRQQAAALIIWIMQTSSNPLGLACMLMRDPVVAADGSTYERAAIAAWIARQQAAGQAPCSPTTGLPLSHLVLNENRLARSMIAGLQAAGLPHS
ncbi:U-box domain-containing 17-like [Chlorella sorokiniana]|uniref:RING-type E3 ubiquitin transferase n=1 Tax=Chlorella sorokiniana TaxID=3076 RepID=A0A2P6TJJ7_CHLSO|nr:U-box domain-containing 17-like [Chlorella sorokiniana]|eukprot:PRW44256.1 U-box domain-containing 17-like [Chlorella sorokiniana]